MNSYRAILIFITLNFCFTHDTVARTVSIPSHTYKIEYQLPVSPEIDFENIEFSDQWQSSANGWIKEDLFQKDFWAGSTPKVAWLKVTVEPSAFREDSLWFELASSGVTRAKLYRPQNDGSWQVIDSDEQSKHSDNFIRSRFISFKISTETMQRIYFLRVEASNKFHLQFNLKTNHEFFNHSAVLNFIYAMGYGLLLIMVIYNVVIGRNLNDKLYFIYSGAILSTLIYQFFAHGHARIFAHFNWDVVNYCLNILVMVITTLSMYFLYYFCNLRQHTPNILKFCQYLLGILTALTFIAIFIPPNWALNLVLIVFGQLPLIALFISIYAWYRGSQTARIFIIAWTIYIFAGFLWLNYWLGVFTLNEWIELPLIIGAALESVLLSLALAYRIRLLNEQAAQLELSEHHYKQISRLDSLTQLANRRAFDRKVELLRLSKSSFGLLLLDIDNFKMFNDKHGHLAGDQVLVKLADILKSAIRQDDLAVRMGGEEFAVIMSDVDDKNMTYVAERIRKRFASEAFEIKGEKIYCSVSIGISISHEEESNRSLIERTDKALYKAKNSGRNQVQTAELPAV
ncbi:GGDEF domain-containing protein [Aliikangiella marina]|nr:GGDEF domain-containing protein [Aliikangiella marina]